MMMGVSAHQERELLSGVSVATRTLNKDGVCCLGNHGARRGEGNLNTYPAPLKLKASTNKLAKTSKSSDGVLTAFRHFHPLDPLSVSGTKHLLSYRCLPPSRSLLLPTLSFKRRIFLSPSSACSRRRRPLIPVTRPPKVIWPTFLSAALWDIWALRPVFWRAICAPSSYPC